VFSTQKKKSNVICHLLHHSPNKKNDQTVLRNVFFFLDFITNIHCSKQHTLKREKDEKNNFRNKHRKSAEMRRQRSMFQMNEQCNTSEK